MAERATHGSLCHVFCVGDAALFALSAASCLLLSRDYLSGLSDQGDEYYLLILLATLGAVVLVYSSHMASLRLVLELLSVGDHAVRSGARCGAQVLRAHTRCDCNGGSADTQRYCVQTVGGAFSSLDPRRIRGLFLAGVPLAAGFIGKFYLVVAAVAGEQWLLLAAWVLGSAIGIYYYLRVVFQMSQKPAEDTTAIDSDLPSTIVVPFLIFVILLLGILPQLLIDQIQGVF